MIPFHMYSIQNIAIPYGFHVEYGGVVKYCFHLVLKSPVLGLPKDWDWTGPRLEKTGN